MKNKVEIWRKRSDWLNRPCRDEAEEMVQDESEYFNIRWNLQTEEMKDIWEW